MQGPACSQRPAAAAGTSRPFPRLPAPSSPSLPTCRALPQPAQRRLTCGFSHAASTSTAGASQLLRGSVGALGSTAALLRRSSEQHRSRAALAQRGRRTCVTPRACGIIGIYKASGDCNVEVYEGLLSLQHRGQDSAGMVTTAWRRFHEHRDNGLTSDVFKDQTLMNRLKGNVGIGHVRYPTAGTASASEAQPFFVNSPLGIYLIHNGNVTNTDELRAKLNSSQSFFNRHLRTDSDSEAITGVCWCDALAKRLSFPEVLLNILADEIHRAHQRCLADAMCDPNQTKQDLVFEAGEQTMRALQGAYSCIALVQGVGLVAFRDPFGIRPLVLGLRRSANAGGKDEWCVASEDCAFGPIGFRRVRDVAPGEMIVIDPEGQLHSRQCVPGQCHPCIFEYIYLARPDSVLNDISVYNFQLGLGTRLAQRVRETGWDIDCIVPVPDGSRPAAIQMSAELGLPYREGLVKNRYVGRTFIMPDQNLRELSVRRKLNAMPAVFEGRSVLLVDDSIVRGTTMSQIVDMVRRAGAKKVYLCSASPPVRYPNVYGVDMPTRREFVATNLDVEQIREVLGADGLLYQTVEDLFAVGREQNPAISEFEASCFTGKYITGDVMPEYLQSLEDSIRVAKRERASCSKELVAAAVAATA